MSRDEIKRKVQEIYDWDRRERRALLQEQSRRRDALLRPVHEACEALGHELVSSGQYNIAGDMILTCKWCGRD